VSLSEAVGHQEDGAYVIARGASGRFRGAWSRWARAAARFEFSPPWRGLPQAWAPVIQARTPRSL